jgi:K(+)-stimulated pyrophosphate-energized sodium pump
MDTTLATGGETLSLSGVSLTGTNLVYVVIAAVIALVALGFAAGLVKLVLATDRGTTKMQEIAGAVQEGASAYLGRQFRTLGIFVIVALLLLLALPVNEGGWEVRIGRSAFFVVGAVFSASSAGPAWRWQPGRT